MALLTNEPTVLSSTHERPFMRVLSVLLGGFMFIGCPLSLLLRKALRAELATASASMKCFAILFCVGSALVGGIFIWVGIVGHASRRHGS
jgi:hypothetical protein